MPNMQMYPSSTRTGIKELDDIIAAVLAGDLETLRKLVRYTTTAPPSVSAAKYKALL